ncbi:MAG: peptide ABC transporter substrate-binding protein [Richelia sp. RM1_1_1]|nr:peptide ABC transporter substrate-binding protein [Richelia sp. RM1_1_1]
MEAIDTSKRYGNSLNPEQLRQAKDWISDCCWEDLDPEDVEELTPDQIERGIDKNFDGGLEAFKRY